MKQKRMEHGMHSKTPTRMNKFRTIHRWLGLIVGIQVLLWISGGVVMSVIPIEMVRGNHLVEKTSPQVPTPPVFSDSLDVDLQNWESVAWVKRAGQVVIKAKPFGEDEVYLDALSGKQLPEVSLATAVELAAAQYRGSGSVIGGELLITVPQEVGHLATPVYRVSFDDWIHTDFYISPQSGEIRSVRSDLWRFYDLFWMLHIMDYQHRENFNNWLVITAAIIALLFCASGFVLLYFTLAKPKTRKMLRKAMRSH